MGVNSESENWVENVYPIKIKDTKKISAGTIINNKYLLKSTELSGERLLFIHTAIQHLSSNGFTNTEKAELSLEGVPFTQAEGKNYILTEYLPFSCFTFDEHDQLEAAVKLMACMHNAGIGFTKERAEKEMAGFSLPFTVKCSLGDTPLTFRKRCNELKKFKKKASHSVAPFDRAYLQIADAYCALAEELTVDLENSDYGKMSHIAATEGCLCHRDFTGHNIVKSTPPTVVNFDEASIELPLFDVVNLLRRRLRKCGWNIDEAHFILNTYCKIHTLSHEEIRVLKIILQFPQKLWRITNKYYNSKRSRYEKTALSKLDEILQEQEPLAKVIKEL